MADPKAQRTLVKSPPELWAEISDVSALARHLGEFGEIRIIRLEPETTVAWEGDRTRGTVALEPSGWGTKVTLTARVVEPAAEVPPAPGPGPDPDPDPGPDPAAVAELPRERLLARLLRRRRPAPVPAPAPEPEPPAAVAEPPAPPPATPEELEALLAGVLDDLGSAHHRPFSRG